ncbi:MAG: ABC transporter ATP-binding protein [Bacteroidetes bacterium]|nr:ABC transporter ATP-binding protein [Bacteroidota bacterium]MCL2328139.1 ABC transporter ATP-binding protein [Bacteroidota bacterium]
MIEVKNISKKYKSVQALQDISFSVEKGEIFGLIGPDGAGKTTLFRILTTLILADSGTATLNGWDIIKDYQKIRNNVGYMPGRFSLYQTMTVEENLDFFATLFHTTIAENYDLIKDIYSQIEPFKNRMAGKLSGGMKQKLALSCALIHRPLVLFLDEPTTGIDPVSRKELWAMLRKLKNEGITIVVSTPYMDEAMLCDRIALMQKGTIMTIDTPQGIIDKFPQKVFAAKADNMSRLLDDLRGYENVKSCYTFGEFHHFTINNEQLTINNLKRFLIEKGHTNLEIKEIEATIEDCFMNLTDSQK